MSARVLLIDDDAELTALMADFFRDHEIALEVCHDGQSGLRRGLTNLFDLVLLDVMLPRLDGFSVLRRLRAKSNVPVLMLTAKTDPANRIAGLNSGADDYLPKPFDPQELLARVHAILRRSQAPAPLAGTAIEIGTVRLHPVARTVEKAAEAVTLTSAEFDILHLLMRNAGRVVTRDEITLELYQRESTPFDRWIDVHMSHLRKKLEHGGLVIGTVRGTGYHLNPGAPDAS